MGEKANIDVEIAQTAARQWGNVTRRQLLMHGMAPASIAYRVKIGRLYRVHRGVYAVGKRPVTPQEHAMAAVLACGDGAVLSHGSALALWGIWKRWDRPFHTMTTADRRPQGIKVHRKTNLDRRDITRHYGIPVTTLARTLLDMAPQMRPKSLNRAVNDGRREHHLSLDALAELVRRYPAHPGAKKLTHVLGIAPERPSRSDFEDGFPAFCERYGLPEPLMNVLVCGYEVDALFPQERVIVELDGWPYHQSKTSFEGDRTRDAGTLAAGFPTVRITEERFEGASDEEAARLHTILRRRRRRAA